MRRPGVATRITWFVIAWTLVFHYESLRARYLQPLVRFALPKLLLLFPPAGWIMFYRIEPSYGFAEVYGFIDPSTHPSPPLGPRSGFRPTDKPVGLHSHAVPLDPHAIFPIDALGYDNIRRNVLVSVLSPVAVGTPSQCRALQQQRPRDYHAALLLGLCADPPDQPVTTLPFCRYLQRKFPAYERFAVVAAEAPDLLEQPNIIHRQVAYQCP